MALIQVNYLSQALFRTVPVNVILPVDRMIPGTDRYLNRKERSYQTLYLLHGLQGNYTDWVSQTRIQKWAEEKNLAVEDMLSAHRRRAGVWILPGRKEAKK